MSKPTLIDDPKYITDLVDKLRHEAMLQELGDLEWVQGNYNKIPDVVLRMMTDLRSENARLTNVILSHEMTSISKSEVDSLRENNSELQEKLRRCKIANPMKWHSFKDKKPKIGTYVIAHLTDDSYSVMAFDKYGFHGATHWCELPIRKRHND